MKPIPLECIRPEVRSIEGYHLSSYDCPIKLNQNESPFDIPDDLKADILVAVRNRPWSRYLLPMQTDLAGALAGYAGWTSDGVIVCNGSNTLIQLLVTTTTRPGDAVVVPSPSFSLYGLYADMFGGRTVHVPLTDCYAYDVGAIREAVTSEHPRLVFICSPNNPTGCAIGNEDLLRLLEDADGLVVVDEAYGEFSDRTALDLLPEFGNLVVLKTFSKALGAAGIRIGYLLGHPPIVAEILKAKIPFDINVFSHTAAMRILDRPDLIRSRADATLAERDRVESAMQKMHGVTPYPSSANFILFEVPDPAALFNRMVEQGVLIRDVTGYPMLGRAMRVSIGTPDENDAFLAALRDALTVA